MNLITVNDVIVRKVSYLNSKDETLLQTFLGENEFLDHDDKVIPIIYQYQESRVYEKHTPDQMLGYVTRFYTKELNGEDYLLCSVRVDKDSPLFEQFANMIDNYTMRTYPDGSMELYRLVIYNKQLKKQVIKERLDREAKLAEQVAKEHDRHGRFKKFKPGTKFNF